MRAGVVIEFGGMARVVMRYSAALTRYTSIWDQGARVRHGTDKYRRGLWAGSLGMAGWSFANAAGRNGLDIECLVVVSKFIARQIL